MFPSSGRNTTVLRDVLDCFGAEVRGRNTAAQGSTGGAVSDKQLTDQLQALQALLEAALVLLSEVRRRVDNGVDK